MPSCFVSNRRARGPPRDLGGQSRSHAAAPTAGQSPSGPFSLSDLQWILIDASESLVNMRRFGSATDLDFRFCIFAIFVLPLYYFLGGSSGSCGSSAASDGRVTIHCKYAVIGAWAYYAFSTWPLFEFRKSALLLFSGPGGTRGPSRKRKKCRLRSFGAAAVRKTDQLHIYNGF